MRQLLSWNGNTHGIGTYTVTHSHGIEQPRHRDEKMHQQLWFLNPFRVPYGRYTIYMSCGARCTCICVAVFFCWTSWKNMLAAALHPERKINIFIIFAERTMHGLHLFWPFLGALVAVPVGNVFHIRDSIMQFLLRFELFSPLSLFGIGSEWCPLVERFIKLIATTRTN